MKTVKMVVKGGACKIQTEGFHGASCLEKTRRLKSLIGVEAESPELTAEYHEVVQEEQHARSED